MMEAEMVSKRWAFLHNWHSLLPEKNLLNLVDVKL
jgi:hypothetical protein